MSSGEFWWDLVDSGESRWGTVQSVSNGGAQKRVWSSAFYEGKGIGEKSLGRMLFREATSASSNP